jgi:hypothetical protein
MGGMDVGTYDWKEASIDPEYPFLFDDGDGSVHEPAVLGIWTVGVVYQLRPTTDCLFSDKW